MDISQRPKIVERRVRAGDFEGDLINGLAGTGHFVTLAERTTRFTLFGWVESKEADAVARAVKRLLEDLPPDLLQTLTFDKGKEFARFRDIEESLGLKVYFAKPYHSWERGTNENRNGIVSKVKPKGSALNDLTDEERARIDNLLNDRPMRCLGWRTPRETFLRQLSRIPPRSAAYRPHTSLSARAGSASSLRDAPSGTASPALADRCAPNGGPPRPPHPVAPATGT